MRVCEGGIQTSQTFSNTRIFLHRTCWLPTSLWDPARRYLTTTVDNMQGRASKAPKKELVIESPQQYKSLAAAETEVDTVPQVVVSHSKIGYSDK